MNITPFDGKVISQPGVYSGIPIETYHHNPFLCSGPSVSSSGLRQFIARPSLYWCRSPYNSGRFEDDATKSLNFGQAAHHLLLGEQGFAERFALRPETYPNDTSKKWNANSNDCKAWLEEQETSGKRVITQVEINHVRRIRDALASHPAIQGGILNGLVEHTMLARFGDIWVRARPDVIPVHGNDYTDLKTTARIDYPDLERAIFEHGYHVQAAMVRMVARQVMDGEFGAFFFCFVEKTPPYDVRLVELREQDMDLGEKQVRSALARMAECIRLWKWPGHEGFEQTIAPIGLPGWGKTRIENELEYLKQEQAA